MQGITVKLSVKTQTGTDGFNRPIYSVEWVDVENVLVSPASSSPVTDAMNFNGKKAVYTLGIPKGDAHTWEDQLVQFFDATWHVFGFEYAGIDALVPTPWNAKAQVERYG